MKTCCHCSLKLPFQNFSKNRSAKDKLNHECKKCVREYHQKYYLKYSKKILKSVSKYQKENKDKVIIRQKKYYKKNKVRVILHSKKHYKQNQEKYKKYYNSLKTRDRVSDRKYNISISDVEKWQDYKCAICQEKENGRKLDVDHNHKTGQIRMLLCRHCNTGSKITDNHVLCRAKAEYLEVYL